MTDTKTRLNYLYNCFINDTGTPEEIREFWLLLNETESGDPIKEAVFQLYDGNNIPSGKEKDWNASQHRLLKHLAGTSGKSVKMPYRSRLAWAAAIILLFASGIYIWVERDRVPPKTVAKNPERKAAVDVAPGMNGAILTLADGSMMVLDSLGNGVIANQNGARVVLENGQLVYDVKEAHSGEIIYNTISTPKGRQFRLLLPDGTKVWLNAASSLRYPTVFAGAERNVQVSGEAYFEVAKDPDLPFKVQMNDQAGIEVLGTSFNVNAYEDEGSITATLLNGSVKVYNGSDTDLSAVNSVLLAPGQQSRIIRSEGHKLEQHISVLNDVNVSQVMAWKNGLFDFQDKSLEEVMRQLSRWYDIEVFYEKEIPNMVFWGKMDRGLTLNSVLSVLEGAQVHFRLEEGHRLVVLP